MSTEYCIIHLPPRTLATTEVFVTQEEIPQSIPKMLDEVYAWIKEAEVMPTGKNIVLYDQFRSEGMRMRVGFPVNEPFLSSGSIRCTELPALSTAQTRHTGAYSHLPSVHAGLNSWCIDMNLSRGDLSIEEYEDWQEDESNLVTDVYIQILD